MKPGALIADRFEVDRRAGAGGMCVVYRARDRETGATCAVKLLARGEGRVLERFDREARVLADLRHPGIVRYVHHGLTGDGDRYLAMEWLDGEDLSERLRRAPLGIGEALTLARIVAEALGFAHARNVVHRDIKPSNLFLPDGRVERVKVLDFGIARLLADTGDATRTGVRVGTPAYMSPEQARGLSTVDARSDVFSLGCVLYETLTGRKAFGGGDAMAVLAKVLLAEPAPVERIRSDTPAGVVELLKKMLAKEPEARPRDAVAVAAETARLADALTPLPEPVAAAAAGAALTVHERRLISVVLAHPGAAPRDEGLARLIERATAGPDATSALRVDRLDDGTIVILLTGTDAATDLAGRAARVALALREITHAGVALATGRAVVSVDLPVGEVIESATKLLLPQSTHVCEVTAGLLDARFEISGDADGLLLVGERAAGDVTRTLLGRPTPCVGRDAELAALEATYEACADGEARAVLITAPAGVGKSRLRYELLRRLVSRGPEVWIARGDPLSVSAPFGLLGAALRRAAGILDGEPLENRQRKLRARVTRHVDELDVTRVCEFLGELIGTPFSDVDSVQLRAARQDAMLMGDQMLRAWTDFLAAECAHTPVVLILEDLHWGDAPTVTFVDAALRTLRESPFLVLGLARPEAHELFPRLWHDRGVQVFRLGELPRRAAERLAREVLGGRVDDAAIARLVERAAGNAFYLEELLRAVAEGRHELPETVLSMVQARLEGMESEARRVLRAASVFGEVFWTGGVVELLGGETAAEQVDEWLRELASREVVTPRAGGRFPGEVEYIFRHDLVREAAYAMLVDADRTLGHRLAGAWLARVGEPQAIVLAEHFERGGEPHNAVGWWRRGAEQALGGNDLASVLTACERGIACGAAGDTLGALRLIEAEARMWRAEYAAAEACAEEAMRWLPAGGAAWYSALDEAALAAYSLGDRERLVGLSGQLGDLGASDAAQSRRLRAAARIVPSLLNSGLHAEADEVWGRLLAVCDEPASRDPSLAAAVLSAHGSLGFFDGDPSAMRVYHRAAVEACERAGDLRGAQRYRGSAGYACLELGAYDEAVRELRDVLDTSRRLGLLRLAATARQNLGLALAHSGALDEARAEEGRAVQEFLESGNRRMEAASRYYLGWIRLMAGDEVGAEKSTRAAVEMALGPPLIPAVRAEGLAILAAILLARGRADEAREAAAEGKRLLDELGGIDGGESMVRLSDAETRFAVGDLDGAGAAIASARDRLRERAARIGDADLRASFLERVPENARTLALAADWLA